MKVCGTSPKSYIAKHFDAANHRSVKQKENSDLRQLQCDSSALGNHFQPVQWCSFTGMELGFGRDLAGKTMCSVKLNPYRK